MTLKYEKVEGFKMNVKRTFSLEPEVEEFLKHRPNRSKVVNEIIKRYIKDMEQADLIKGYQAMATPEAMEEFSQWEAGTISDGLD